MEKLFIIDCISESDLENIRDYRWWKWSKNEQLEWQDAVFSTASEPYKVAYAHRGDILINIETSQTKDKRSISSTNLCAPKDGFYIVDSWLAQEHENSWNETYFQNYVLFNNFLFYRFDSIEEWEDYYFEELQNFYYEIEEDQFDGKKRIIWYQPWGDRKFEYQRFYLMSFKYSDFLYVEASELGVFLKFMWCGERRKKSESCVGDTIILLLADKTQLTFVAKDSPSKDSGTYFYRYPISQENLDALCANNILAIKKIYANGDEPVVEQCDQHHTSLFRVWLKKHVKLIEELGFKAKKEIAEEAPKVEGKCYVYLMLDEANGYYKIGISNKPNYRERTLQSEKPTIKLICSKEYHSRRIAEAIESALHKAYTAEHMRGEWFNLTAKDVQDITLTLA